MAAPPSPVSSPLSGLPGPAVGGLTRARRLVPGDRVALVAPSGRIDPGRLQDGCAILRSWGLEPVVGEHVLDTHPTFGYLAGTDADRAADFQAAWLDPTIAAVLCARGGYGTQRVVDLLDWDALRAAPPKVLIGFSDATVLHELMAQRLGLATLYGPMGAGASFVGDGPTAEHLRRTLFDPASVMTLTGPDAAPLLPGRAHGITAGGCASLLAVERGTPGARPSFDGAILLLEDVNEHPYQLDRILTQLLRSGALEGVRGVALGSWEGCGRPEQVREIMLARLEPLGVPVLWELGFGHGPSTLTVPLGVPAVLDADAGTLTLELPALAE
ncbi:muramoyltetrapeptide carboxypeptidase [Kitasatospora sp. MAP12-15]|uniref:S66 peptidase family protein n=1 Tax=unclassified Kitasatospora TaxID=2633591 RepID=UPI0024771EF1|nr:LD-carboxypeptidase [Kitasatospora sp. MAP12-44]MDH6110557.1 muramoyltetrapeptide carboxypeptidase [Kitasatospora sp. MAP12-44]